MSQNSNSTAFVIMIDDRFFYEIKNNRVRTAWSFTAAKFFTHNSHYKGIKSTSNIEFVKSQLDAKGKKYQILTVKVQLPEKAIPKKTEGSMVASELEIGDCFLPMHSKKRKGFTITKIVQLDPNNDETNESKANRILFLEGCSQMALKKDAEVKLLGKENVNRLDSIPKAESQPDSFVCKGCNHILDNVYVMRTEGWCYMCDPHVTLEELLADEPVAEQKPTYLFPTDILI